MKQPTASAHSHCHQNAQAKLFVKNHPNTEPLDVDEADELIGGHQPTLVECRSENWRRAFFLFGLHTHRPDANGSLSSNRYTYSLVWTDREAIY